MAVVSRSGESDEANYTVRADTTENTLYLELVGSLDKAEMEQAADETVDVAARLDEGFDVINDISAFTPPSPEAAAPIKRAQTELKGMGVGTVIRVVAEETSAVTENAFQRRSRKAGYEGTTTTSVAAAERRLD